MAADKDESYALPDFPSSDDEDDQEVEVDSEDKKLVSILRRARSTACGLARGVALTAVAPPAVAAAVSVTPVAAAAGGTANALPVMLLPGPPDAAAGANALPTAAVTQNSQAVNPKAGRAAGRGHGEAVGEEGVKVLVWEGFEQEKEDILSVGQTTAYRSSSTRSSQSVSACPFQGPSGTLLLIFKLNSSRTERTGGQLKKIFNKLSRTKVPRGEQNILPTIEEAKAKRILIMEKSEGATWSEEESFAAEDADDVEYNGDGNEDTPVQVEVKVNEAGPTNDGSVDA